MTLNPLKVTYIDGVDTLDASTTSGTAGINATNYQVNQSAKKIDAETISGAWTFTGLPTFSTATAPWGSFRLITTNTVGGTNAGPTFVALNTTSVGANIITESVSIISEWRTQIKPTGSGTVDGEYSISAGTSSVTPDNLVKSQILSTYRNQTTNSMEFTNRGLMVIAKYSPTLAERTAGFAIVTYGKVNVNGSAGTWGSTLIGCDELHVYGR